MQQDRREPWQISAARYCVENSEKGFVTDDLKTYIKSQYSVNDAHINQFIEEELQFPLGSTHSRVGRAGTWIPPLDLVSKVTDYDELRHARASAQSAWKMAAWALIVSGIGSFFQALQYLRPLN